MESVAEITKEPAVITGLREPSTIAYINVFDEGDVWVKTKGCEGCGRIKDCCKTCPFCLPPDGCTVHIKMPKQKPFLCVTFPLPSKTFSYCQQEFKCIHGPRTGTIRKIAEPIPWLV
jgi:hypothetical protein